MRKLIVPMMVAVLVAVVTTPSMVRAQAAPGGTTAAPSAPAIKTSGFWLETKLRTAATFTLLPGFVGFSTYSLPGFVIGGKFGRMVLGLSLDLASYDWKETSASDNMRSKSFGIVVGPVLQIIVAAKGALAAYVQAAVGLRYTWGKDDDGFDVDKTTTMGPAFNFGIGFRYFLHPSFALGPEFGTSVDVLWTKIENPGARPDKERMTLATFYAAITAAVLW